MIVLDASAAIEWALNTPLGARVATRIGHPDLTLHAPHLIDLEVAQVLRRIERSGAVARAVTSRALADFAALEVARYGHDVLLDRVWALRGNLSAYDAAYAALAEALDVPLVTTDARLAAAPGLPCATELLRLSG